MLVKPCGQKRSQPCVEVKGSSRDDAMYLQAPYLDAHSARPGCFGNGKPVYVSDKTDDEEGVAPYLYSPARRNSWLVGTDPCMGNGWVEVRTSAERAEHIQAGASGPWQEFNGTGWVRSAGIRALPHCGTASDDCLYVSGTKHQQHTHGIYARTSMLCDGKPVSTSSARATTPLSRPPCPPCTPLAPRLHPACTPLTSPPCAPRTGLPTALERLRSQRARGSHGGAWRRARPLPLLALPTMAVLTMTMLAMLGARPLPLLADRPRELDGRPRRVQALGLARDTHERATRRGY